MSGGGGLGEKGTSTGTHAMRHEPPPAGGESDADQRGRDVPRGQEHRPGLATGQAEAEALLRGSVRPGVAGEEAWASSRAGLHFWDHPQPWEQPGGLGRGGGAVNPQAPDAEGELRTDDVTEPLRSMEAAWVGSEERLPSPRDPTGRVKDGSIGDQNQEHGPGLSSMSGPELSREMLPGEAARGDSLTL